MRDVPQLDTTKTLKIVLTVVALILVFFLTLSTVQSVGAGELVVIQSPVSGTLSWYTTPGVKWRGFGHVTTYKKREQFWFSNQTDQGQKTDQSTKIRFNDGGHAAVSGSMAWEMPTDTVHLNSLHTKYGSQEAIDQQLIRTVLEKSIYMTGPLMSSAESYAVKRNDLISFIEDQLQNGVYKTRSNDVKEADPITGEQHTVTHVELVRNDKNQIERQEASPLNDFGIRTFNLSLNEVKYDDVVERQIQSQQVARGQVQTAIANAKRAEQDAITAQKNGEAKAAEAKWEQEVIKARAVTEAQQKLEVSELDNKAAEQYKQAQIKKGEGEGAYKRAVMQADGALDKKLNAYVEVQKAYAAALASGNVSLVPQIVAGSNGNGQTNGLNLIDILGMKAARELALDVTASGAKNTKQ